MSRASFLLFCGLSIIPVGPVWANSITFATTFSHGTDREVDGSGQTLPGTGLTGATTCSTATGSGSQSTTCSGTMALLRGIGHFGGVADATASTAGGLSFGTSVNIGAFGSTRFDTPPLDSLGVTYFASGSAIARVDDSIAIMGTGTVDTGFLRLVFDVDGSVTELLDEYTGDGFAATVPGNYFFASGSARLNVNTTNSTAITGTRSVTLDVPLLFGIDQPLSLVFASTASARTLTNQGYQVNTDFLHTAVLANVLVLDGQRQTINGAFVVSANGVDYGLDEPAGAVPEPGTLALIGTGLASSFIRRRGRRRPVF